MIGNCERSLLKCGGFESIKALECAILIFLQQWFSNLVRDQNGTSPQPMT